LKSRQYYHEYYYCSPFAYEKRSSRITLDTPLRLHTRPDTIDEKLKITLCFFFLFLLPTKEEEQKKKEIEQQMLRHTIIRELVIIPE